MKVIFISRRRLFVIWIILGLLMILVYVFKTVEDNSKATFASPVREKIIVVDAGHGGIDPGAVSKNGVREDEINLKIAKKLKNYLERKGARVIMTRKTHQGLYDNEGSLSQKKRQDMQRRIKIIRDSNADIVVSIHLNYFRESKYYGAQTFYMAGSEKGKKLAGCIQEQLIKELNRGNTRRIKPSTDLLILKAGSAPCVIVECGFLSNPEEEKLLQTDEYQDQVAKAICNGIVRYFSTNPSWQSR